MAQRDWIASMILLDWLHARAKRVVLAYISIVRRSACCAPGVILQLAPCPQTGEERGEGTCLLHRG